MIKELLLLLLLLSLTACGLPQKFDDINANMVSMTKRIDRMAKNTDNMDASIGSMTGSLSSTSKGIHSQSLMIALNELLKPENTKYITLSSANPIPMIASAKAFAEIATAEELAGLTYLWISEINLCQIDDVLTKEQKDSFDLGKWIKLNALQLISGFIPEKTIGELVKSQITDGGSYRVAAYQLIVLRYLFIKDFLLENTLSAGSMTTPAQYETVLDYIDSLKTIKSFNFSKDLNLKIYGFFDTNGIGLNQTLSVDTTAVLEQYYKKLSNKFSKELDPIYLNNVEFKNRIESIQKRIGNQIKE